MVPHSFASFRETSSAARGTSRTKASEAVPRLRRADAEKDLDLCGEFAAEILPAFVQRDLEFGKCVLVKLALDRSIMVSTVGSTRCPRDEASSEA